MTTTPPLDLTQESRYHRQELITWWDQAALLASRVLVVGAGALGNEIAKNLAMLGVGHIELVDMDHIEHSNLSRAVLFRNGDEGGLKAEIAAARLRELNPDITVLAHTCTVERLGVGYLRRFDLVIAGLDNREARLWVNQSCRKLGITWIDGAIEGLRGLVRVFPPSGACYECTLGETDRSIMAHRQSCALLTPDDLAEGKVPTNATTASIIAAIQVQEAIKLLVGRRDLVSLEGRAFMYTGDVMDAYRVVYEEDDYCLSHDFYDVIVDFKDEDGLTPADLVLGAHLPEGFIPESIDFEDDLLLTSRCADCGVEQDIHRFRNSLAAGDGVCDCGGRLSFDLACSLGINDPVARHRFSDFGAPLVDIVTLRRGSERVHVALAESSS